MKVLSLLQPWATLVVIGAKKIETRSWNTKYRGPLLIHASKKMTQQQKDLVKTEPFWSELKHLEELPLGKIIGMVELLETSSAKNFLSIKDDKMKSGWAAAVNWDQEIQFGDYSQGRYGWLLSNPVSFTNQIECRGSLSLWDFDYEICRFCGCTDLNCQACIEKTGSACYWVEPGLCSACDTVQNHHKTMKKLAG